MLKDNVEVKTNELESYCKNIDRSMSNKDYSLALTHLYSIFHYFYAEHVAIVRMFPNKKKAIQSRNKKVINWKNNFHHYVVSKKIEDKLSQIEKYCIKKT
jgi:hypothetical protein